MRKVKISLFLIFFSCFFCCNKVEEVYLVPEREDIADAITEKVMNDEAMSIDGLNDAKPRFCDYVHSSLSKSVIFDTLQKDYLKIKFGRIITNISDPIVVCDIHWDSAWIDLKYDLSGTFKVVQLDSVVVDSSILSTEYDITERDTTIWINDTTSYDSTIYDTVSTKITWDYEKDFVPLDSSIKSFSHTTHQKAIFLREQNTNDARKDWKLKYITPLIFESSSSFLNISQISISSGGLLETITFPSDTGGDPLLTFFNRDNLPTLDYNSTVSVSVITQNSSTFTYDPGELVLMHFGREVNVDKKRVSLNDEDNDGMHTGNFTTHSHGEKVYRLFIDMIDLETIFTSEGEYRSSIWMVPFQVP